jgi:hypothetical protein
MATPDLVPSYTSDSEIIPSKYSHKSSFYLLLTYIFFFTCLVSCVASKYLSYWSCSSSAPAKRALSSKVKQITSAPAMLALPSKPTNPMFLFLLMIGSSTAFACKYSSWTLYLYLIPYIYIQTT